MSKDRLLSDDALFEELGNIVIREGVKLNPNGSFLHSAVDLINTQKRLYAESVIGEDEKMTGLKDKEGFYVDNHEQHLDTMATMRNVLRAEQRARIE